MSRFFKIAVVMVCFIIAIPFMIIGAIIEIICRGFNAGMDEMSDFLGRTHK